MEHPKITGRRVITEEHKLIERIDSLEAKVDQILAKMEQAQGAWLFIKWVGGIAVGLAVIINATKEWISR